MELIAATAYDCGLCESRALRAAKSYFGITFGGLSLAFLFGAMGPFNFDGLEALYRDWEHNPIIMEVVCYDAIDDLGARFGRWASGHRRPWRDDLSSINLWSECFALWLLASTVINPWYLLWLLSRTCSLAGKNLVGNVDCRDSCSVLAGAVDRRSRRCRRAAILTQKQCGGFNALR